MIWPALCSAPRSMSSWYLSEMCLRQQDLWHCFFLGQIFLRGGPFPVFWYKVLCSLASQSIVASENPAGAQIYRSPIKGPCASSSAIRMDGLTVFKQLHPIGGHGLTVDEYAEEFDDNSRQTYPDWLVMSRPSFKKHRKHLMLCAITRRVNPLTEQTPQQNTPSESL